MIWRRFIAFVIAYVALDAFLTVAFALFGVLHNAFALTNTLTFILSPLIMALFAYRFYRNTRVWLSSAACFEYAAVWFFIKVVADLVLIRWLFVQPPSYVLNGTVLLFYAVTVLGFYFGFRLARSGGRFTRPEGLAL